jgi:ParB family transcriptional regulator, chromosome partitioning protein
MERIIEIPRDRIRPFANQPREYFNESALKDLARSIKAVGQQVEIRVRPLSGDPKHDYELIDGQRRWLACQMIGKGKMKAIVLEVGNQEDQFLASIVANFAREGHTVLEVARAIDRILKRPEIAARPTREQQFDHISEISGKSRPWIYSHLALLRLHPDVQALMSPGVEEAKRLTLQTALLLGSLPLAAQAKVGGYISSNELSLKKAQTYIRKYARAAGIKRVEARTRPPSERRQKFTSTLSSIEDEIELLLELKMGDFTVMFADQPRSEQESAMYRIGNFIEHLGELRQALASMLKRKAA